MMSLLLILAFIGFGLSLYAYITEQKVKQDASFKPACDISDKISCSRVMLSPYAKMLFVSNAVIGMAYYALIAGLAYFNQINIIFFAAIASCLVSLYLAYLLIFKIKSFCVVCSSLYVVNILILFLAYKAMYA
jgi:vitamin-K-epoxide reductase (warfarin-sensitive)